MEILSSIFNFIAKKLGFEYVKKDIRENDFDKIDDISLTAAMAYRVAVLTLVDFTLSVVGDNKRADFIRQTATNYRNKIITSAATVILGTGGCIVKPNTDGIRIAFDIIPNNRYVITDYIGDHISGVLILCDEVTLHNDKEKYRRFEYHRLIETEESKTICVIQQLVTKGDKIISIEDIPKWQGIKEQDYVPNVDKLLLGIGKNITIKRDDVNNPNGVPITYGLENVLELSKRAFYRFNEEFEAKETMIFAETQLFRTRKRIKKNANGEVSQEEIPVLPKGKERLFKSIRGANIDSAGIKEYSPEIRHESLLAGLENNFKMIELLAGFSSGVMSNPTTNFATATEMKASLKMTYAFMSSLRVVIETMSNDLLYAADMIANRNNITPPGNWSVNFDWSDSFIEDMKERFNQLIVGKGEGVVSSEELRAWLMSENTDQAKEALERIKSEQEPDTVVDYE